MSVNYSWWIVVDSLKIRGWLTGQSSNRIAVETEAVTPELDSLSPLRRRLSRSNFEVRRTRRNRYRISSLLNFLSPFA
jgi:hypothetical protein